MATAIQMRIRTQENRIVLVKNPGAEGDGTTGGTARRPAWQPMCMGRARGGRDKDRQAAGERSICCFCLGSGGLISIRMTI